MVLQIRYKNHPNFNGFRYVASVESVIKGDAAAKKELKEALHHHMKTFRFKRQLFGKMFGKDQWKTSDIEAWIEDAAGNKVETLT